MKDYFSSRNEKLLKKLFESQKITVKEIGIPQMTAWQTHVPDETQRRRIEEDFKSTLQENWLAAGNEALTNEELQAALESIISEKIDIENDKIAGKTIAAHVDDVLPLVDDPKTGNKIANPSKEEEIENIIKQTLTNTNDKIQALGTFYQLLSKKENEANGDAAADSPEEEKKKIEKQVKDALEDDGGAEPDVDIHLPLTKGEGSLAAALIDAGASDDIAKRILKAVADQLKVNNIQFVESKLKRTIKEALNTMNEGKENVRDFIARFERGDKSAIDDIRKHYAEITVKGTGGKTGEMIRAWADKNNIDLTATSVKMPATADSSRLIAFMEKNPALQQLMSKVDSNMDVTGFIGAVIELMIEKNPEIDVSRALMKIAPLAKAIEREKEKAKEDVLQGGFDSKTGDLKLATRKGAFNFTGIRKLMHNHLFNDPEKARAITRQINNWLQNNITKEDGIKLVESDKKFFNSLLETLKALKKEVHLIVGDDEENQNLGESKDNPYAICTASVGREDEKKYKSCKDKVAAKNKK
tara:strand:- start:7178 stop:8764 length:1587 start_codon:yes stop_codon:yes gene_type:complete